MKTNALFRNSSLLTIFFWLGIFAFTPMLLMVITSFLSQDEHHLMSFSFTFRNYTSLTDFIYYRILWQSIVLACLVTIICLIIGYPAAYFISQLSQRYKPLALLLLILPFWTSSLIRTYAIFALLKTKGMLNSILLALGLIHHPLQILYSNTAVLIGCVYDLLPFMVLPLYSNIDKLDKQLIEAARDLGASRIRLLKRIILPLTLPGIIAGSLLVFLPTMTLFYIPTLLGGAKSMLMGNLIENQFLVMRDWPGGAASSVILTALMLLLILIYRHYTKAKQRQELLV